MALKKPSDLFDKNVEENNIQIIESDNTLREELVKVENLSEQVIQLQQELSQKVIKSDLESLVLSQINTMQENFEYLQNDFRKSNKKDIVEFKEKVSELTEIVGNLIENELPKYRKQVTKNEVVIDEKFNEFIVGIRNEIDTKVNDIAEVIDTNLEYFNTQLQETSSESKNTSDTYNKLSKIVENRISKENNKLDEYSQVIQSLHKSFVELQESLQEKTSTYSQLIEDKFETISSDVNNKIDSIDEDVDTFKTQVSSDILSIKADVVINEQHIKNVDKYLQNHHQKLVELKEEVFGEIEQIQVGNIQENLERLEKKIDYIKETYSKIEPEVIVKEVIKEGLLNEPPDTKNSDPLTPLDQKFVTLDQLQKHYSLFINRIQQQLSTLGGGGETQLRYLDDVVGIATNASAYDGKYLQWNSATNKAEFVAVSGGGGSGDYASVSGVATSVIGGIGSITQLNVSGNIIVGASGINTIFSTTDITSWYYTNKSKSVSGDDTLPSAVYVGAAGTAMFIVGDTNNRIIQYTLSTPYDVSTAGVAVTFFSTAIQETIPTGIDFNTTGTKMFVSGQTGVAPLIVNGDYVHEYSLSTPWNVAPTSVGYTTSYNVTQDATPNGVTFGDSGSKMYVVGATNDVVYQYSLSTPYSLASGVTYDNISLVLGTNPLLLEISPTDISFNSTGTVLWIVGNTQDRIYEFRLGTAWDISTAVFYDDVYIGFNEITVTGLHVIPEQNVAYIVGSNSDTIYQYSTNTPAIEIASSGISSVSSIVLNNETRVKDKLYVKGLAHFDNSILTQSDLTVNSSATVAGTVTAGAVTVTGTLTGNAAVTFDATASNINLGTSQVSGTIILGGTSQTSAITLGRATTSQTTNIQAGASGVGTTKTINFGTGGASGSFTQINIGPTAGVGTITVNSGTNLGIGGVTNPSVPLVVSGTSRFFTSGAGDVTISHSNLVSSIKGASTVQLALGANNTDVIRINNSGLVGIGTTNPTSTLHVVGNSNITGIVTATELDLTASSSANNSVLSLTGTPTSASGTNGLLGIGALSFSDTDIIANFTHNVNGYAQVVVQNKNSGASSSADIIVNNDRAAGTTYYGDFGINATTFSGGGVFGDPDGTYLYSAGSTLSLGSLNAYAVKIATNNTERVRVSAAGSVGIGTASPAFAADIAGDARVTSTNKMRFGGTAGTTNFYIQYNSTTNSLDFVAG